VHCPSAAQRHLESSLRELSLVSLGKLWGEIQFSGSNIRSGVGTWAFHLYSQHPHPVPASTVLRGSQLQHQHGWPGVKHNPTNPVHLGHLCKAAHGEKPLQPPKEMPRIAVPRAGHGGAHVCPVFSSGGDRVRFQSVLSPPNKGVIKKAERYQPFSLWLARVVSNSNVF